MSAASLLPARRRAAWLTARFKSTLPRLFNGVDLPPAVTIVDVGPRDGLQNEPAPVPTAVKIGLIDRLAAAGVPVVEATSFVSPKWVPQLADAADVLAGMRRRDGVRYPVLTPNLKGLERALAAGATDVAIFAAATESFSRKNLNASIDETLARYRDVVAAATEAGARVRGYVSVAAGCPYEGAVAPAAAAAVAGALHGMGCYEVSLGDTVGVGTPGGIAEMFRAAKAVVPVSSLASHCHDTYGQGVANVLAALGEGVAVHDASVAGLGGCPFAPGATGNVATEDVVYMLHGLGISTGIDVPALLDAADFICGALGRPTSSRAGRALRAAAEREKKKATAA